jgi:tryptophanyl-tRNA synthetase
MSKKILLSGVKPTGLLHVGNYFGAIKQFVDFQDEYETIIFIADLHAITTVQDKDLLSKQIYDIAVDYMACGLDPEKALIFKQSDIPEVAELAWYFNCITTVPYLERAHAYKDAEAKGKEVNMGVFDYPILMAADILIQDADVVPVGKDQKQHIEYARDTAEKFNRIFNTELFKLPKEMIVESLAVVPGIDGQKMSKSYGNVIPLFAERDEVKSLVMRIPTDSKGVDEEKNPEDMVLYQIHKIFNGSEELFNSYKKGLSYKEAKEKLVEDILTFSEPFRKRRAELHNNRDYVLDVLKKGGERAKARVEAKMEKVRNAVGVKLY